jgi:hypothetical protein
MIVRVCIVILYIRYKNREKLLSANPFNFYDHPYIFLFCLCVVRYRTPFFARFLHYVLAIMNLLNLLYRFCINRYKLVFTVNSKNSVFR